jgi:DNA-binding NarL/FixJ family response regulator
LIGWVRAEVARLDPLSTALVELLALIDGEVDPDDLSRIADQPLEDIAVALERLVRCGLVVEQDHGHSLGYALAYPLIREALRVGISGARRRVLHRQVARRLLVGDGSTGATPPIEGSARKDFDRIDALITAIGQAEQQGSHAQVWSCLQTLLDLLSPGDPRVRDAFDALSWQEDWEVAYWAQPCVVAGVPALRRMEQLLAASADAYRTASVRFRLARILTLGAGDLDSGRHECRQALALFQQAGCEQEARIAAIELARLRGWAGDLSGQEHGARQALGEAEKMSDQRAIARALWVLGLALDLQGRFGEAEDVLLRGVELARAGGRSSWRSRQLAEIAVLDAYRGHMASARARWQEAVSTHACPEELVWASGAQIALLAGDLATVAAHAHEATVHCPDARSPLRSWMAAMAAMAAAEGDRIAEARRDLERAELLHQGRDLYLFSRFCRWAEGAVALAEGRLANAAAALRGTVRSFSDMGAWTLAAFVLADLAETSVAADDPGAAMWAAGCADDIAHRTGSPSSQALERFAAACASLLCDHHDEAADAAARAASGFGHSGHIMLEARAHVVFAAAAQRHDRAAAAAALHKAAVAFDGCGAVLRREQARQLLTRLSTCGQRAAASSGPASLTTRELQVAELAARGYTARQIARSLCIGTRTGETHLARIYPKLGVTSKQDLVHRGPQLGLAAAPHYSVVSTDHDCVS